MMRTITLVAFLFTSSLLFAADDVDALKAENLRLKKENAELREKLAALSPKEQTTTSTEKKFAPTVTVQDTLKIAKDLIRRQKKNDSYSIDEKEKLANEIEAFKKKLLESSLDFSLYVLSAERAQSLDEVKEGFIPKEKPLRVEFMLYPFAVYPADEGSIRETFQSTFRVVWFTNNKAVGQVNIPTTPSKEKPLNRFAGKSKIVKVKFPVFTIFLVDDDVMPK